MPPTSERPNRCIDAQISAPVLILAGGQGSRLGGIDKAFHEHAGQTLIHRALLVAAKIGPAWVASSRSAERYRQMAIVPITDAIKGYAGPLSGLLAGFRHRQQGVLLSMPVDLFGVCAADLRTLLDSLKSEVPCCYAMLGERPQPLLAAWRVDSTLIEIAEQRLSSGQGAVYALQDAIGAQPVEFRQRAAHWHNLNQLVND